MQWAKVIKRQLQQCLLHQLDQSAVFQLTPKLQQNFTILRLPDGSRLLTCFTVYPAQLSDFDISLLLPNCFHYSEPHLCTLIKQNTGHNFTGLIKRLRLAEGIDYLTNTQSEDRRDCRKVGYNSADHFSRVFRSTYKMSPQEYRKQNSHTEEAFVPFEVKTKRQTNKIKEEFFIESICFTLLWFSIKIPLF